MRYYLEPYTPIVIKKIINNGYYEGLFDKKSNEFDDSELKLIYNYIRKHGDELEFVVMKYNHYYQQCTVNLN